MWLQQQSVHNLQRASGCRHIKMNISTFVRRNEIFPQVIP